MTSRWPLVVAVLVLAASACGGTSKPAAGPSPSVNVTASDPQIAAYRSKVNEDVNTIDFLQFHKLTCKTRDLCISQVQDLRAATATLIEDLATTPVPPVLAQQAVAVQTAAQQLLARIDGDLTLMRQPGSDYVKLSADVDVKPLEVASGSVICWPGKPVPNEGGESAIGYVCGS